MPRHDGFQRRSRRIPGHAREFELGGCRSPYRRTPTASWTFSYPSIGSGRLDDLAEAAERAHTIRHVAAHETVRASARYNGDELFDFHPREEFGYASMNFISMASEQIEEHLAEYLGSTAMGREVAQSASDVEASIGAWQRTLETEPPPRSPRRTRNISI